MPTRGPYRLQGTTWRGHNRTDRSASSAATGFVDDITSPDLTRPAWFGHGDSRNNVGCLNTNLRVVSGVTQAVGKVHENLLITGQVTITQPGQTFRNCRMTFSYAGNRGGGMVYLMSSALNSPNALTRFEHCEIEPETPGDRYNALYGHDFVAYRCALSRSVDGVGAYNSSGNPNNVWLLNSWVGNLAWFDNDRPEVGDGHTDGTHNDGIQNGACTHVHAQGCFFQGAKYNVLNPANCRLTEDGLSYTLANGNGVTPLTESGSPYGKPQCGNCFIGKADAYGRVGNITFERNWVWNFSHGFYLNSTIYSGGTVVINNVTVKNNIFGGRWADFGGSLHYYPIRYDNNCVVNGVRRSGGAVATDTWGNVWAPDANPGVNYSDGTPVAGSAVRHRVDSRTAAAA